MEGKPAKRPRIATDKGDTVKVLESENAEEINVNFLPNENTVTVSVWRGEGLSNISYLVVNEHDARELATKLLKAIGDMP